ncbi:putative gamma-glutamylcyclotransferase CG2811 isoform X2 [Aricia agestis]|uniref:putative gamma-glutamylcyclotransferase CG2811 isoform X2 n=1 Tax=Aricia agestis TaxID=91739 RepID=UPI001C2052F3|nr:putative gamma-glutamylcyclotransferase CG2811 isoform X2 [Aricia agestis]
MLKNFTSANISNKLCYINLLNRRMVHKVFVYGTLKNNEPNHNWLTDPENGVGCFISEGTTKQKYPLIIATKYNIPFLLFNPGQGHHVRGEIYEVDDKMLSKLDILEDHPNFYVREVDVIITKNSDGQNGEEKCWVYFLKQFRPELMKFEQFENYSSAGSHGLTYMERSKRDSNYNYKSEVHSGYN